MKFNSVKVEMGIWEKGKEEEQICKGVRLKEEQGKRERQKQRKEKGETGKGKGNEIKGKQENTGKKEQRGYEGKGDFSKFDLAKR